DLADPGRLAAEERHVVLGDVAPLQAPRLGLAPPRRDHDDLDVAGLRAGDLRTDRRPAIPDVAHHVAVPKGRGPAREDHVDLSGLVVGGALADVAVGRQADHLPGPREKRKLAEVDDDVTIEGERRVLAPEPEGQPRFVPDELDRGVAHELLGRPAGRNAFGRKPDRRPVADAHADPAFGLGERRLSSRYRARRSRGARSPPEPWS